MKWTVCLLASLLLAAVECQVLDIRMHPTPGDTYCGNLQCVANSSLPVIAMIIYDITEKDNPVKLVSISIFAPELSIEQSETRVINATGAISKYAGILGINFTKATDCLYRSFQCELDFVDANGQPDVFRANLIGATEQNVTVLYKLAEIATQLKQHSEETDIELKALQQDNQVLQTMLGSVTLELSRVEELLNSTLNTQHDQTLGTACFPYMPHKNAREKFLLYGNVPALCDTESDGGGWVVIQRRVRGDVDFYRVWDDYKRGFGTPDTDFWIGNDIIHNLTSQDVSVNPSIYLAVCDSWGYNQLRIELSYTGNDYFAQYTNFIVADESSNYRITISGYFGNSYDSMASHNGASFSTSDRDNDLADYSCSEQSHGSWWYTRCYDANLNGAWAVIDETGIAWSFDGISTFYPLTFTEMKIRHI